MSHAESIVDEFTFQADAYAHAEAIRNEEILNRIVAAANPQPNDEVLDIACGPGILTCALAQKASHVAGIDLTPAMLEQARKLQHEQRLTNITWLCGDVSKLPCAHSTFAIVTCRYAFHHFRDPLKVLKEMKRVCQTGGRIVVVDTAPARDKAAVFNRMEKLRDNSHSRALPVEEMLDLFAQAGLTNPRVETLRMAGDLNSLLARSRCLPGDEARCRQLYEDSLVDDRIDMQPRRDGDNILYAFPVAIVVAERRD